MRQLHNTRQIIPVMHWTLLNADNPTEVSLFLHKVVVMYVLAALGFLFYVTLIPERWFPGPSRDRRIHTRSPAAGRFDIFGHSHQWWHVFALSCFVWCARVVDAAGADRRRWFYAGMQLWEYRRITPCHTAS